MLHNHYHVVLFIDKDCAEHWRELEVVEHWHQLFSGNTYSQRFLNRELLSVAEKVNLSIYRLMASAFNGYQLVHADSERQNHLE
jgi:hypothetical protein